LVSEKPVFRIEAGLAVKERGSEDRVKSEFWRDTID
jgi:hypothetical protein